tara:strand:- start:183 stop:506 length:324 start_codon:yes stop_codon:yes gene_type:complete
MENITSHSSDVFVIGVTVFFLACIIGYYVVWSVTPALHSPLMGVTNAISSVIIVGAILAAGPIEFNISKIFGIIAVILASINIFGGFIVTYRMLSMFKKKPKIKKEN